jgi:hypothetical protein
MEEMYQMSQNFVDVVGFQLEKVHTGVIAWLLDSDNSVVPARDKILVLSRFLLASLQEDDISTISPIKEYSFGRRRRIDLVVRVIDNKSDTHYLLIEFKTDSDVDVKQLQQSRDAFLEKIPNTVCSFFILTLGASQFTYQHKAEKIKELGFVTLDILQTRRIFSDLSIKGKNKIYDDWCNALEKEEVRCSTIDQVLHSMEHPWDDRLWKGGYRLGFPVFYIFYGKLREQLDNGPFKNWAIYSGSNNPVMNWQDGWLQKGSGNEALSLYWEFNWSSLVLKAELGDKSHDIWRRLRDEITNLCSSSPVPGRKTADRRGTWVSAYKWQFDFCRDSITEIITKVNMILGDLHEKLRNLT